MKINHFARAFLAALLLSCPADAVPQGAQPPVPAATALTPGVATLYSGAVPVWRPVSTRDTYPYTTSNPRDNKKLAMTTRLWNQLSTRGPVSALKVCYSNFNGVAGGVTTEGDGSAILTVTGSLEINALTSGTWSIYQGNNNLIPLFFNGQRSVTLQPGTQVCSDPVYYPMISGQTFYTRTHAIPAAGGSYPVLRGFTPSANNTEETNSQFFGGQKFSTSTTATTNPTGTVTGQSATVTLPLVPGTVFIFNGCANEQDFDDGNGNITGNSIASTPASTVNYTTGAFNLTLKAACAPNNITVTAYGNSGVTPTDDTLVVNPTDMGALTPGQGVYGPTVILGLTSATLAPLGILAVGDSIDYGTGNTDLSQSWINIAAPAIGVMKYAQPSETAASFAQAIYSRRRLSAANRQYDRVIENLGTNDDYSTTFTLAQFQAAKLAIWSTLAATTPHGFRDVYAASILPRTVSNASQTPFNSNYGSGTVASGSPSLRNAENQWMCGQVGVTIGGFIDTSAAVEGNPATCAGAGDGTWKTLSLTYDGTHPSSSGHSAIGAAVTVGGAQASPAFSP